MPLERNNSNTIIYYCNDTRINNIIMDNEVTENYITTGLLEIIATTELQHLRHRLPITNNHIEQQRDLFLGRFQLARQLGQLTLNLKIAYSIRTPPEIIQFPISCISCILEFTVLEHPTPQMVIGMGSINI